MLRLSPLRRHPALLPGSAPAVALTFAAAGFVMAQALARMPAIRDQIGATEGQLGLALIGAGVGSVLAMPFTGRLADRFGSRAVVMVAGLLACLAWGAVFLAQSPGQLFVVLTLTGAPVGIWDVAMNVQGHNVEAAQRRVLMPWLHAAFSAGTVAGAGLGMLAAWTGWGLGQLPIGAGVAWIMLMIGLSRYLPDRVARPAARPDPGMGAATPGAAEAVSHQEARSEPSRQGSPARAGITRLEILIGACLLVAALAEGAATDWLALALVDVRDAPEAFGAFALMAFGITMTLGRIVGGPLIARLGRVLIMRTGAMLAATGILMICLIDSLPVAVAGGLLWGLGVSSLFPASISAAGEIPGRGSRAITTVTTIGYGAFLLGAPSIGFVAERIGLDRALIGVAVLLVALAAATGVMRERDPAPSG